MTDTYEHPDYAKNRAELQRLIQLQLEAELSKRPKIPYTTDGLDQIRDALVRATQLPRHILFDSVRVETPTEEDKVLRRVRLTCNVEQMPTEPSAGQPPDYAQHEIDGNHLSLGEGGHPFAEISRHPCYDCDDTGIYVGLNERRPCPTCR